MCTIVLQPVPHQPAVTMSRRKPPKIIAVLDRLEAIWARRGVSMSLKDFHWEIWCRFLDGVAEGVFEEAQRRVQGWIDDNNKSIRDANRELEYAEDRADKIVDGRLG